MRRGELWTVSGGPGYMSKTRPVVILQADAFAETDSITVCGVTSDPTETSIRVNVFPSSGNGLQTNSRFMIDKITTVRRSQLGTRIGALEQDYMDNIEQAIMLFLGLIRKS